MTPSCEAEKEDQRYFNSPPHKKNHIATTMINTVFFKISTHILTKRMTTNPTITFKAGTFQLTSSRRGWRNSTIFFPIDGNFNSHPHEEDDPDAAWQSATYCYFNSHPHEEDDVIVEKRCVWRRYFNSHPHEEDDFSTVVDIIQLVLFQLTSSRRGWRSHLTPTPLIYHISTHILTKRMTLLFPLCSIRRLYFNSHPHEEDDAHASEFPLYQNISTHILTKRMTKQSPTH